MLRRAALRSCWEYLWEVSLQGSVLWGCDRGALRLCRGVLRRCDGGALRSRDRGMLRLCRGMLRRCDGGALRGCDWGTLRLRRGMLRRRNGAASWGGPYRMIPVIALAAPPFLAETPST